MPGLGGKRERETNQGDISQVQGRRGKTKQKRNKYPDCFIYIYITNKTGREKGGDHEISFILWWCFLFVFLFLFKEG